MRLVTSFSFNQGFTPRAVAKITLTTLFGQTDSNPASCGQKESLNYQPEVDAIFDLKFHSHPVDNYCHTVLNHLWFRT